MGSPRPEQKPDSERIDSLINEYFDRRQAREDLTPESFAAEHPDLAEELRPYLAGLTFLDKIRPRVGSARRAHDTAETTTEFPTIGGYELQEEIGRGGMGVIYKALQVSTKRVVALKVMSAGPFASDSARRRFDREVELAARLQHPSIVRVLESGEVEGQRYYAMDYVPGVRLDRYLSTLPPDVRATLRILQRICEAVAFAHHHGVIHRDLKPANVLIDDEGRPHILDFGLAKATDQPEAEDGLTTCVSLPGQVLGTLFYLSPEQAAGTPDEIDARTDVYALGVMLFETLTGSLPFETSGRPSEIIRRILEGPPTRPSLVSDLVDNELETMVLKALEKDKARRYQSPKEMGEDIHRYLEGEPILAKRPSSFYILRKKLRKHRMRVALGVAVVALSVVGLLAGSWWRQHAFAKACRGARQGALLHQRNLESGAAASVAGAAQMLYGWYRNLGVPESALVAAHAQHQCGLPEQAIITLERALQDDPSQWAFRSLLAEIYRVTGAPGRADELRAQAERDAPDTAEGWYLRSFATLDLQHAFQCAQEAVKRDASHALAWARLTYLCRQTGDLDGVLRGAEKLIELERDPYRWAFFRGSILCEQGRYRQAIQEYHSLMDSKPVDANLYLARAHAYRGIKQYDRALADYDKAVEIRGKTAEAWAFFQRATPLWILGRGEEAVEDYRRVRTLTGRATFADARQYLILRELHREREAGRVLEAALQAVKEPWLRQVLRCLHGDLTPDRLVEYAADRNNLESLCEAYYYAAEACLLSNRPAEARKWFEECVETGLEFDPDTAPATPMNEYELARWRLETLFADAPTSPPEKN